jgi:hypothetical protein
MNMLLEVLIFVFINGSTSGSSMNIGNHIDNFSDTLPKRVNVRNERLFCSAIHKTRYKILVTGNKIKITSFYENIRHVIVGTIKKGKIYSNDPEEKQNKSVNGKYYILKGNLFRVLNIENGDYEEYESCK